MIKIVERTTDTHSCIHAQRIIKKSSINTKYFKCKDTFEDVMLGSGKLRFLNVYFSMFKGYLYAEIKKEKSVF